MKTKTCPECEGIMEAKSDCNGKPIWACRCCWMEAPRKVRMTASKAARIQKSEEANDLINELLKG